MMFSFIFFLVTLVAAIRPATATLAVPWMSSLNVQYLSRYLARRGPAFGKAKSSNWKYQISEKKTSSSHRIRVTTDLSRPAFLLNLLFFVPQILTVETNQLIQFDGSIIIGQCPLPDRHKPIEVEHVQQLIALCRLFCSTNTAEPTMPGPLMCAATKGKKEDYRRIAFKHYYADQVGGKSLGPRKLWPKFWRHKFQNFDVRVFLDKKKLIYLQERVLSISGDASFHELVDEIVVLLSSDPLLTKTYVQRVF